MNRDKDIDGDVNRPDEPDEDDTIVLDIDDIDNVGDMSVEIDVDELVAKIEADNDGETAELREARRKLDALEEQRRAENDIGGTYNINLDDDL